MPELTTFLTYDNKAEEAAHHYVSVFDGRIVSTMPGPSGAVMGVTLEILGQKLITLNGGPSFSFTQGISLCVQCDTQAEIDRYWDALVRDGGKEVQCGWLVDKFGVSWQIVPKMLGKLFASPERDKAGRAFQAMMKMKKFDIATLQRAYDGA